MTFNSTNSRSTGMAHLAALTLVAAAVFMTSCKPEPVPDKTPPRSQVPLPNTETEAHLFRAQSERDQGCLRQGPPEGEITYSDLEKIGTDRWVFLRDTKDCKKDQSLDLKNKYFGILTRANGRLTAAEVDFDLTDLPRNTGGRPSDLEAFCVIGQPAADGSAFEMIAVESGGYQPEDRRKLFRIGFSFSKTSGAWSAEILGKADYHTALKPPPPPSQPPPFVPIDAVPADFEVEGMLCDEGPGEKFTVILADRGRHDVVNGKSTGGHGGGLVTLEVDFSASCKQFCARPVSPDYVEIVAPKCDLGATSKIAKGQWRDIAALYRHKGKVWASSTFEGEVDGQTQYCSVIYQLCDTLNCTDIPSGVARRQVIGVEVPKKKIEGLTEGWSGDVLATASDEETEGLIDVDFPVPTGAAQHTVIVASRTTKLEKPVAKAVFQDDASKVLIVFDLDDTLLTMKQDLGGVAWFKWQDQIINGVWPCQKELRVAGNFTQLLKVQGILYELGNMKPTEPDVEKHILDLRKSGVATYVLTARGPEFVNATHRELAAAKLLFPNAPACTGALCLKRGVIAKDDVEASVSNQLGAAALQTLGDPRNVNIANGVMMVSGQDKGIMLRLLLKNLSANPYDTVIFVDDDLKNVIDVAEQAAAISSNTLVYHYTRLEDDVAAFFKDDDEEEMLPARNLRQAKVAEAWEAIRRAVCAHNWKHRCPVATI